MVAPVSVAVNPDGGVSEKVQLVIGLPLLATESPSNHTGRPTGALRRPLDGAVAQTVAVVVTVWPAGLVTRSENW